MFSSQYFASKENAFSVLESVTCRKSKPELGTFHCDS